jgi:hypothetical protein
MPVPVQMYVHGLNPLKGWPNPAALDFTGKLHPAVTIDPLFAGRVVHVDSIVGGVPLFKTGAVGTQMPIFLFQGSEDFDVNNPGGTDWYSFAPNGVSSGLVATGAYEFETTEFDTTQAYLPNTPLLAPNADTNSATGGVVTSAGVTVGTTLICGITSRGVYTNAYGRPVLGFWPGMWLGNGTL